jgi:signal transduction histidine kinase
VSFAARALFCGGRSSVILGWREGLGPVRTATTQEDLHTLLRALQRALALTSELYTALEALQRLLERHVTAFEPLHELLELIERLLELRGLGITRHWLPPVATTVARYTQLREGVNVVDDRSGPA